MDERGKALQQVTHSFHVVINSEVACNWIPGITNLKIIKKKIKNYEKAKKSSHLYKVKNLISRIIRNRFPVFFILKGYKDTETQEKHRD